MRLIFFPLIISALGFVTATPINWDTADIAIPFDHAGTYINRNHKKQPLIHSPAPGDCHSLDNSALSCAVHKKIKCQFYTTKECVGTPFIEVFGARNATFGEKGDAMPWGYRCFYF